MAAKKLLVADDSLTIQKVIRLALSGASGYTQDGYDIQTVSDGNDAIQQISLFRPDIVLIDVSLPGKSAFEVKRAINEHRDLEDVRFVLMSSAFEKVDEPQAAEVNFHGRLTKPFDPAHLREVLSEVLAQVQGRESRAPRNAQIEPTIFLNKDELKSMPPGPPPPSAAPLSDLSDFSFSREAELPPMREAPSLSSSMQSMPSMPMPEMPPRPPTASFEDRTPINSFKHAAERSSASNTRIPAPAQLPERESLPLAPPPAPGASFDSLPSERTDQDIRNLTESTIRMSGLDDFGWSVEEHSLKPPSSLMDAGESGFPIGATPAYNPAAPEPPRKPVQTPATALAPPPPLPSLPSGPTYPAEQPEPPRRASPPAATAPSATDIEGGLRALMPQIEQIVRQEVEKYLGQMSREILPDLAERIIKQEIRRMLSDQ